MNKSKPMKCPFRIVKETEYKNLRETIVYETFADCYGTECPFFISSSDYGKAKCRRQK